MYNIFLIFYGICVGCSLGLVIAAILDKGCAERLEVYNWGDVVSVSGISLIPLFNLIPICVFFKFNKVWNKPIHKKG